jgi:ubiquitin-conjugating enzyme E2 W
MASISSRRLAKEYKDMQTNGLPVGIEILKCEDFAEWIMGIEVLGETPYEVSLSI